MDQGKRETNPGSDPGRRGRGRANRAPVLKRSMKYASAVMPLTVICVSAMRFKTGRSSGGIVRSRTSSASDSSFTARAISEPLTIRLSAGGKLPR